MHTKVNRRDFLKGASAAFLAAMAAGAPKALHAGEELEQIKPKADRVILLWMGGAVGQTETFDPKKHSTFSPGMDPKKLLCTFPTINTSVDNIKFCEGMENLASVMDRGSLVRSFVARDYGAQGEDLQHIPFQYKWHTGYKTPSTVPAPFMGAWISKILGPLNPDLPAYIEIGRSEKTANVFLSLQAFNSAGFLGTEHGSLMIPEAIRAAEIMNAQLPESRFENRYKAFKQAIAASPAGELASSYQKESMLNSMENAYRLMKSPSVKAFDLNQESKETREKYNTGPFGMGCLLARRLAEANARFVEVHVDFENAKGWDTHSDGHNGIAKMKKAIDAPIAHLVKELEERGLLERTLVIVATEFGRATIGRGGSKGIIQKQDQFGIHGHFAAAASLLFFGGGIKKGALYGKTNDEFPCETVENPVGIEDIHATLYRLLGIPAKYSLDVEKRPFYITRDGAGKAIPAIMS